MLDGNHSGMNAYLVMQVDTGYWMQLGAMWYQVRSEDDAPHSSVAFNSQANAGISKVRALFVWKH